MFKRKNNSSPKNKNKIYQRRHLRGREVSRDFKKRETKTKKRHQEVAVEKIQAFEINCKLELDLDSQESNKISLSF